MMLAATFFGGINVAADTIGRQALDRQLASTPVDMRIQSGFSSSVAPSVMTIQNVISSVKQVSGVSSVEVRGTAEDFANSSLPMIVAITDGSSIYRHLSTSGQPLSLPNQTLLSSSSPLASKYRVGNIIPYNIGYAGLSYNVNLTLEGFVALDSVAVATLGPGFAQFQSAQQNILIVSWDQTFVKIVEWANQQYISSGRSTAALSTYVDVYLDRESLISVWDIEGSASRLAQVDAQVRNTASIYGFNSVDFTLPQVGSLAPTILALRLSFTIFSIPVFFMAWYVGRTVSQASYNLRRREIGLLRTKGFSRRQLFRHFLVEASLVGVLSGLLGLGLAFALDPYFVTALSGTFQGASFLTKETGVATVLFTLVLTLLSILSPARQASNMDPATALREYVYVEDVQASGKRGAILAFSLGLYKIILLTLGVNFLTLSRIGFAGGFFLFLILIVLSFLDLALTFIGPFLFLYGATQLSTGVAIRFHRALGSVSKRLIGDIASLSSKSVFRNPRRATSLVFLVALIAGYSIWVIGDLASMEDYAVRQAQVRVGSDLRISNLGQNATILSNTLASWGNVTGTTVEQDTGFTVPATGYTIHLRAIDPSTWTKGAYYEPDWFSDNVPCSSSCDRTAVQSYSTEV